MNWIRQDFGIRYPFPNYDIKKPKNLDDLLHYATLLSQDFIACRIDFYIIGDKIIFGEITHYPGAGYEPFLPDDKKIDLMIGDFLKLPPTDTIPSIHF